MPEVLRLSAFAIEPTGGNPAGVVLDARGLDDAAMVRIARDVGYSETAFVVDPPDGQISATGVVRAGVRYFSPRAEVPFCGHATIALAVALAERTGARTFVFTTPVGDIELTAERGEHGVEVSFTSVEPRVRSLPASVLAQLLDVLGLAVDDLDTRYEPLESFAGNWHPIVVVADVEVFNQFRFSPAEVAALMSSNGWTGTVTILHERSPGVFGARNLFPVGRITEDPATGSAAASVGAYLRALGQVGPDQEILIHQGEHVGRPSILRVRVPANGGVIVRGGARTIED
ncbi:MAG: PhzF family phenazine biosynthesis protein [Intrasporangium sp.]|uniref:PhzF family phenazine biosynthesis protein n=1 Tax=Intrasporangium sp. TaxID=1925024 RepID=UPI0026477224|nr:PhzF family phenazine biosynthesis protein [Intrasporangium sp.]MDN5796645.1 PhzF family phenazine biosynthesis protein [Intrasporangium sp.]